VLWRTESESVQAERVPLKFFEHVDFIEDFCRFWCLVCNVNPTEEPKKAPIFYGSRKPAYEIKTEAPLHLAAAHLAAAGANNRRIARALGNTEVWMSNLARQGFFQERVVSILRERNRDALESAFRIQRFSNPVTLVELRPDGPADTRTSRARDILDRAFRKKEVTSEAPVEQCERLECEVRRLSKDCQGE
jgi:hypothetical protein